MTATGAGSVVASISNGAVNSAKISDASVGVIDLNFAAIMPVNTGLVVQDGSQFFKFSCSGNQTLLWSMTDGWQCSSVVLSEADPKVGANTLNRLSKWDGTHLVTSGVYESGGNVGIGNSNPQSRLDVSGTVRAQELCDEAGLNCKDLSGGWSSGTVTSVGLSMPDIFVMANSPITGSGALTVTLEPQVANTFFAAPNGTAGTPLFRGLASADLPVVGLDKGGTGATSAAGALTNLLPVQTGNAGKFLSTDGATTSWASVSGDNLGNHVATQDIDLAGFSLNGAGNSNGLRVNLAGAQISSANSQAVSLKLTPPGGGSGSIWFDGDGVSQNWLIGRDSSASDNFKISAGTTHGTGTALTVAPNGFVSIGSSRPQGKILI